MKTNGDEDDGENDSSGNDAAAAASPNNHSMMPKRRPQLTAMAPGAVSVESVVDSPATPTEESSRTGILRAAHKLAAVGSGSSSSTRTLCEVCSASNNNSNNTDTVSPTGGGRCRRCRRRQLQRRVAQHASERSLFTPRSFRSSPQRQGSVRRIRSGGEAVRDLGQYKLERMAADAEKNNTSTAETSLLRRSSTHKASDSNDATVTAAIETMQKGPRNNNNKKLWVQSLLTIRNYLVQNAGILRLPTTTAFWTSILQHCDNDDGTTILVYQILAVVVFNEDVRSEVSVCLLTGLCHRIRSHNDNNSTSQKKKTASTSITSHALRVMTNLLWQWDPSGSSRYSHQMSPAGHNHDADADDQQQQDEDALLHSILALLNSTLEQHRDDERHDVIEWTCRCYLALDGILLEPKGSKREHSATFCCWTRQIVALVSNIQTNTSTSAYTWPLHVLHALTAHNHGATIPADTVDEIATHIVRLLGLWVEQRSTPLPSHRRPSFLFEPCCYILCWILPRCNNSMQLMPDCQTIAELCCDTILQDDDNTTADTWQAAGRLLSTFASLFTVGWARTERVQTALLDTVELFLEYAPAYTEAVAHAVWTMSCLDASSASANSLEQQQRVLVLLSQAAQLFRGSPYHRTMVLAVSGICYNVLLSSSSSGAHSIVVPASTLGDALADHPQDRPVTETVFAALALVEDTTIIDQVLQRPNVADAFMTAIESDIGIVQVVARENLTESPTVVALRNHAVRELATAASGRIDLMAQLVKYAEPSAALVHRIVEHIRASPEVACRTLLCIATHHPTLKLPLSSIADALQVAMQQLTSNSSMCTLNFQETLCQLVWTVALQAEPAVNSILLQLVLDIIRLHYTEQVPYQRDILRAAAGAVATLAPLISNIVAKNAKDVVMVAEAAYKVLETEGDSKMGDVGKEAVANCFVFLLCACNESLDIFFQSGLILLVADVLESLPACERIQEIGCQIFALFTSKESVNMYLIIAETESISQLSTALTTFPENLRIRSSAVASLVYLSRISVLRSDMVKSNVVDCIASLMTTHVDDETLRSNGIEIINNLVSNATSTGQGDLIAKAMGTALRIPSPTLQQSKLVLSCLIKICSNETLAPDFECPPEMLCDSMQKFYGVASILEPSLDVLAQILSNRKFLAANAMLSLPECRAAQVNGCRCLEFIPCPSEAAPLVLQTISFSMRMFPDSLSVQEAACHTMSMVLEQHNSAVPSYHVDAILDSMGKYTMSRTLQHYGCLALCALSNATVMENQEGMLPILITAAENFPQECGRLAERALSC